MHSPAALQALVDWQPVSGHDGCCRETTRVLQRGGCCDIFHDLTPRPCSGRALRGRGVTASRSRGATRFVAGGAAIEPTDEHPGSGSEPTEGFDDMNWQVGLYVAAVLIPLAAFAIEVLFIRQLKRLQCLSRHRRDRPVVRAQPGRVLSTTTSSRPRASWPSTTPRAEPGPRGRARRRPSRGRARRRAHGPLVWQGSFDWVLLAAEPAASSGRSARRASRSDASRWASTSTTCPCSCS